MQIAFHWQRAGQPDKALAAAVRAGDLARAAHAPTEALSQYTRAIEGWQQLPNPQAAGVDETSLLERAAEAASAAGDNTRAQDLVQRVLSCIDAETEPGRTALLLERLGRFSWLAGDLVTSQRAYDDALRVIPHHPSPARARVLAATAQSLMLQSQYLSCRGYAEQAIAVAQAAGARAEEAHARNSLGTDLAALGCYADGVEMIRAGLQIARQIGDGTEAARCHLNLTVVLAEARQAEEALQAGEDGLAEATALGLGRVHGAAILGGVLDALYLLGRWDEIQARASAALDDEPEPWSMVPVWMPRCRVALARGNLTAAATDLAAMTAVPGATNDAQYGADLATLDATLGAARGDLAHATARAGDALKIVATTDEVARPGLWHEVAASELADPYLAGYAGLQQAASLLARRRRREATAALQDAEAAARRLAAAPLHAEIATLAHRARIELAAPAPAPPPDPDPVGLTPREREVVTLLSDGLSNAEIAKTLYISEKTASVHVSNILRKLGHQPPPSRRRGPQPPQPDELNLLANRVHTDTPRG